MKIVLKLVVFSLVLLSFACKNDTKATKAVTGTAEKVAEATQSTVYRLSNGTLNWTGSKALGDSHTGTINLSSGELEVVNDVVQAGNFVIDMTSITNTDMKSGDGKEKLEGHLKSPDFFDVGEFPTGTFNIVSVSPVAGGGDVTHNVKGNLMLKGVEKSITIPVNISITNGTLSAVSPSFSINRTEWGLAYGSGSLADLAKDKIINDDIALVLSLTAAK